jgi:uncharacterized membrane protein
MFLPSAVLLLLWQYTFVLELINNIISMHHFSYNSSLSNQLQTTPFFIRLINSIKIGFNGYLTSFVGTFGWATNPLPLPLVYLYLSVLTFVSILKENKFTLSIKQKSIFLMIFLIGILMIFFIATNWRISQIIWGVRERYFIPFAPLFFLIFQNKKITNYLNRKIILKYMNLFIIVFIFIILIISTYYLINIGLSTLQNIITECV